MKSKNKKRAFIAVLSVFAIGASSAALAGCNKTTGYIDAPERIEAELGTYVIPDYEVVDKDGMVLAGYNVYLKSVTNADGEAVNSILGSAVTIDDAGVYSFVYSAGSKKVKDVTVSIDFADRTAPTINYEDDLPKFFIKGNSYKMPSYTLSGDYDRSKCWAKVFHVAEDKTEKEVAVTNNRFKVEEDAGYYAIRIHVEDAAGNSNDYEYTRKVDGPATVVENKVLYLDEEFGERQVSCYQSYYTGGYVSKDADGAHTYNNEAGAYKVSFDGVTATKNNEGLVIMDVPAIIDINEYEELYMYVYNDSGTDIIMGSQWWNDTKVPAGKWTRLSWNTRAWGNNVSANSVKQIGLVDITGMTIRFIFDYGQTIIPNGTFYLSAMYGTPKVESEIELGEHVDITSGKHYINDVIELNAETIDGKTVDYYKIDGEIIPGNSFTVTKDKHKIEVVYLDGELTKENMTWASPSEFAPAGSDAQTQYMGTDEYWTMSYDVYGVNDGWKYFGVYIGGTNQLLGFELIDETHSKLSGYAGVWKWGTGVTLSPEVYNLLRSATQDSPVKAVYVRRGSDIRVFLVKGNQNYFIGSVEFSEFGVTGNNFGYGTRKPGNNSPDSATVVNFRAVAGSVKTNLYFENFTAELTIDGVEVEDKHYLGDKVTLTVGEAPADKMFAYFTVNGERLYKNEFVITSSNTVVETVYTEKVTVNLAEGIKTEDGKSGTVQFAKDSYIVLTYTGTTPAGKYYIGFTVDGEEIVGNEVYITADTHDIDVLFGDKIQTGSEKLNDISDTSKIVYASKDGETVWKPASVEHVTNVRFSGSDGAVDEDSVLKIVTGNDGGENSFAFESALAENLDAYKELYFYVYTEANGLKAGGWWCADTNLVAGEWTKVSFGRNLAPGTIDGNGEDKVWENGINKFAYRIFGAPANVTVYVTAVYGVPYPDSTVTKSDSVTVSAPANGTKYKVGETVTLTAGEAPEGTLFAYFTANGERIEGNTFVLTETVEFGAVYNEISTLTLGNGIKTSDENTVYARDVKVTLVYEGTPESGKLFDYFTVDGKRIAGNTFVTKASSHTVSAVFADGAENLTWITGEETDKTDLTYSWPGYNFNGSVLGESEHWAISAKITELENFEEGKDQWYGFDFLVGTNASIEVRMHTKGSFSIQAMGTQHSDGKNIGALLIDSASIISAGKNVSVDNPVIFTVVRDGDVYYVLFNGKLALKSDFDFKATDNKFGVGKTVNGWLTFWEFDNYSYRAGEELTEYLTEANAVKSEKVGFDKMSYKLGETVTLSVAGEAPEGTLFAYFTANGEPIEGDTYQLLEKGVRFDAVFNGVTNITVGNGVTVIGGEENEDGSYSVGRGATVTLKATVPAGKYLVCFKVDGEPISGNTFKADNSSHSVEAVFEDKTQTDSEILNGVSDTSKVVYASKDGETVWKPASVEYVTDVKFEGNDAAVSEDGLIKIVTGDDKNGENSFAFNSAIVGSLDKYKEIYFYVYTEASGISAGGWWCGDTVVTAGKWTKVSFGRNFAPGTIDGNGEDKVWENGINKFAYRIFNAPKGVTVYVTELYGVPYGEVSVTVEESVKDYISVTGDFREEGTITIEVKGNPDNKDFVNVTVNGETFTQTKFTYTLGTEPVTISALFTDAKSKVELGDGVKTSDGKTEYLLGAEVTLVLDEDSSPANKVFDHFEVDKQAIQGNKFTTSQASHEVEAIYIDKASDMTWIGVEEKSTLDKDSDIGYQLMGADDNWVISYDAYDFDVYSGGDDISKYYIGAYIGNVTNGTTLLIGYEFAYGNKKLDLYGGNWLGNQNVNLSDEIVSIFDGATSEKPITLTYVRYDGVIKTFVTNGENTYIIAEKKISDIGVANNNFGLGKRDSNDTPELENIKYVTGVGKTGLYLNSLLADISYENASAENEVYYLGDTVTLIADEAEAGHKFLRFTVNGEPIKGNSFVVESNKLYEVVAEYSEISTLNLGDGVTTADGEKEYARGVTVTLSFDSAKLDGKLVDYYIVDEGTDSEQRVFNSEFVTTAATHTVKAVLATVEQMTWITSAEAEEKEINYTWSGSAYKFSGKSVGEATHWAIEAKSYGFTNLGDKWYSIDFLTGNNANFQIRLYSAGQAKIYAMGANHSDGVELNNLDASVIEACKAATEASPVTFTAIRSGNTYYLLFNGKFILKTQFAFNTDDNKFGVGENDCADWLVSHPTITYKYVMGESKVDAYVDYLNANAVNGQSSEAQINNINWVTKAGYSKDFTSEYISEDIPEGLNDANIKEQGVLKVTATGGNDIGLYAGVTFEFDPNKYSEIYFYVYIESETDEVLNHVAGASYWKDGVGDGTIDKTNKWVKISFDSALIGQLSGANTDLSKFVFRVYSKVWYTTPGDEFTDITGKTFYITSLYGVPKDVEPLAENGATSYTLVGENDELTGIIYDNFFPDAE